MPVLPPSTSGRGGWLRILLLFAWLGYALWAWQSGRATGAEAALLAVAGIAALALHALYRHWWNRPIDLDGGAGGARPPPTPSALDDLKFPLAMAAALVATMLFLGFPGGGLGAALLGIAALALLGWMMLNRAIGG